MKRTQAISLSHTYIDTLQNNLIPTESGHIKGLVSSLVQLYKAVPPTYTFLIVSNMDLPPFHGLVDFLMQLRLAILCHFRSSNFLWKALASIRTLSYR